MTTENEQIARALGYDVLGECFIAYSPDCGSPEFATYETEHHGIAYLPARPYGCSCPHSKPEERIHFGHHEYCLEVIEEGYFSTPDGLAEVKAWITDNEGEWIEYVYPKPDPEGVRYWIQVWLDGRSGEHVRSPGPYADAFLAAFLAAHKESTGGD